MNPKSESSLSSLPEERLIAVAQSRVPSRNRATELLLRKYEPLVRSVALSSRYAGVDTVDLLQSGRYGFLVALKKYDPTKGASLGGYAKFYVVKNVESCFSAHLPRHISLESILSNDGEDARPLLTEDDAAMQAFDSVDLFAEIAAVRKFIETLTPRQQELVRTVFYGGSTPSDASRAMHISKPRVSEMMRDVFAHGRRALVNFRN